MAGGVWRLPVWHSRAQNDEWRVGEGRGAHRVLVSKGRGVRDDSEGASRRQRWLERETMARVRGNQAIQGQIDELESATDAGEHDGALGHVGVEVQSIGVGELRWR